jgi:predicted nucleotidyltransferase component of viral defense system
MKLHENTDLFQNYIALASQEEEIDEAIVVKDYFVTLALKTLYSVNEHLIFIGGTSLSKCFHIINRFSEDIDLVATASSRKAKQRQTSDAIQEIRDIWNGLVEEQNKPSSDFKEMYLHYPSKHDTDLDQRVKIELITFMEPFPIIEIEIVPIIYKYLEEFEKEKYEIHPVVVKTQEPYRTMIEKILLEKELYKEFLLGLNSDESQEKRARDFYDIHKIWQYYNKEFPIKISELNRMIDSRISNRRLRTTISLEELKGYSLLVMFEIRSIGKQLTSVDQRKLSIRDLNIIDIKTSLEEIDKYFNDLD